MRKLNNILQKWRKNTDKPLIISNLNLITFPITDINELNKITSVICSYNNLQELPYLPNAVNIDASYNLLTVIDTYDKCIELNISNNNINELSTQPVVYNLNCSNNAITLLPNLPYCMFLDCSNNLIHKITSNKLPNIEYLYFENNMVTKIPYFIFMKEIKCKGNNIPDKDFDNSMKKLCIDLNTSFKKDKKDNKDNKLLLRTKNEILSVINAGGFLVRHLSHKSAKNEFICEYLDVSNLKLLGKGNYGSVYEIKLTIPGMNELVFAVKKTIISPWDESPIDYVLEDQYLLKYLPTIGLSPKSILPCRTIIEKIIPRLAKTKGKDTIIPIGSYICESSEFSEFSIALLLGELYNNGKCINFISTLTFATCKEQIDYFSPPTHRSYNLSLMHKIDDNLYKIWKCVTPYMIPSITIQLLAAIHMYQSIYKISHNDLHDLNIFVEFVTPELEFNGNKLQDADYFHYSLKIPKGKKQTKVNLYIPFVPIIIKIGDFGLSFKWSKPLVGDSASLGGYYDEGSYYTPNWYSPQFDVMYSLYRMVYSYASSSGTTNKFINDIFINTLGDNYGTNYFDKRILRPLLPTLEDSKAKKLSTSSLFNKTNGIIPKEYFIKPTSGNIVTIGTM